MPIHVHVYGSNNELEPCFTDLIANDKLVCYRIHVKIFMKYKIHVTIFK